MDVAALLLDLYGRIPPLVEDVLDGLERPALTATVVPGTNAVAWLVWHLTRVQDHHLAELRDDEQTWTAPGWAERFGFAVADPQEHGYGHTPEQVAGVVPADDTALAEYHDAVWTRTRTYLAKMDEAALDEIVDRRWDPPVTRGVRLISVADDCLEHVAQAAYLRGLLERR